MNFLATSIEEDVVDTSAIVKALLVRTGGFVPLDESTYKVKKIVAALNESQVPPPDVLDVVVCPSADYMDLVRERVTNWENVVLAYDPAWATGTGKVVTPPQVQEVHSEIRKCLEASVNAEVASMTRIICAVPLTSKNCPELAAQSDVDGFLVRGAPLKPEFIGILMSATTQDEA
ncbi:hypothetical protein MLD38_013332 [Melastoma candidum]|uniref:Uncharacterized protein n=1 Tax=Melastoma candidum TaxID=119954 RepID=A0ACB9R8M1_9MYRT|nr:hypothetical protein MLD38_013332 [Melastoma candidum]